MKKAVMKYGKQIVAIGLVLAMVCGGFAGLKLYNKISHMADDIAALQGKTGYLQEKLNQTTDYYDYTTEYTDDTFNYFAIGNSLTLITSWRRGICSTQPDNDYFHILVSDLSAEHGEVVAYPYNFANWERSGNRSETLDLLDCYLSDKLDLVSIQLGENASNLDTYQEDLKNLIEYVRKKSPNARIIVIGDWWSVERNRMRKSAAESKDCLFADLSPIIGNKDYQSETGSLCYLEDGTTIEVSKEASTHPGDKGMKYIADAVIKELKEND